PSIDSVNHGRTGRANNVEISGNHAATAIGQGRRVGVCIPCTKDVEVIQWPWFPFSDGLVKHQHITVSRTHVRDREVHLIGGRAEGVRKDEAEYFTHSDSNVLETVGDDL